MERWLEGVFVLKIVVTGIFWAGLPLLAPVHLLEWLGFPPHQAWILIKLLGMAYASLLVSYAFGLEAVRHGKDAHAAVWTGIVSNGGACVLLIIGALSGTWAAWGPPAQVYMWGSLIVTGLITAGLLTFGR